MRIGIFESKLSISRIVAERNSTFQIILEYLTQAIYKINICSKIPNGAVGGLAC